MCSSFADLFIFEFMLTALATALYLNPLPPSLKSAVPHIDNSIVQVMREASLLYCLPDNPFLGNIESVNEDGECQTIQGGGHAVEEATYACTPTFCKVYC